MNRICHVLPPDAEGDKLVIARGEKTFVVLVAVPDGSGGLDYVTEGLVNERDRLRKGIEDLINALDPKVPGVGAICIALQELKGSL